MLIYHLLWYISSQRGLSVLFTAIYSVPLSNSFSIPFFPEWNNTGILPLCSVWRMDLATLESQFLLLEGFGDGAGIAHRYTAQQCLPNSSFASQCGLLPSFSPTPHNILCPDMVVLPSFWFERSQEQPLLGNQSVWGVTFKICDLVSVVVLAVTCAAISFGTEEHTWEYFFTQIASRETEARGKKVGPVINWNSTTCQTHFQFNLAGWN